LRDPAAIADRFFRASRGLPEISRHSLENWICLHKAMSDGTTFQHAGNVFTTRPGGLLLPFSGRPRGTHDYRRWMLPRNRTCRPGAGLAN
jgi:hypothetical protein